MIKENFEIVGGVEIAADIQHRIKTTGVRGLSLEKAQELGLFQRIANLLCVMHASFIAANHVYGSVVYIVSMMNARKNEIAREMNLFEKAYERFMKFWTGYYAKGKSVKEVKPRNREFVSPYHGMDANSRTMEFWRPTTN